MLFEEFSFFPPTALALGCSARLASEQIGAGPAAGVQRWCREGCGSGARDGSRVRSGFRAKVPECGFQSRYWSKLWSRFGVAEQFPGAGTGARVLERARFWGGLRTAYALCVFLWVHFAKPQPVCHAVFFP